MRFVVFAALLGVAAAKLQLSAGGSWSYDAQDQWPGVCQTGKRQSPIGLRSDDADRVNVTELRFHHYDTTGQFYVVSNGKGARVHGFDSWKQGPYIDGGGLHGTYALDEIHFVWKRTDSGVRFEAASEHSINGYPYPVEIHMMHRGEIDGQEHIAAIAILVQPHGGGMKSNDLNPLFDTLGLLGDSRSPKGKDISGGEKRFKPVELLPADRDRFYRYEGSLTTPNCDEVVTWIVFEAPLLSTANWQWKRFTEMEMPTWTPNQRHQQPLNGRRVILRDSTSTKTEPSRPAGGRDSNATTSGIAAHGRCAFWPLVSAIVVLLIVDVNLPDGSFY